MPAWAVVGGPLSYVRGLIARRSRPTVELPHLRTHCPLCGTRVVEAKYVSMHLAASFGPSPCWSFTDDELVEMCPLHQMLQRASVGSRDDLT